MDDDLTDKTKAGPGSRKALFGLDRRRRFRIYGWTAVLLIVGALVWVWWYLRPERWYTYTDQVAFEQVARDVEPGFVIWEKAEPSGMDAAAQGIGQPTLSSDGTRMIYSTGEAGGDANLFLRQWDGVKWGESLPMRALNSDFHETSPALSGDGAFLFFTSNRPGGRGGEDIWVARWDGVEYAWPLPLTGRVNTAFDETDPEFSPDGLVLHFASNRPIGKPGEAPPTGDGLTQQELEDLKRDYDLYMADVAGDTPFELIVERRLSMLYSLREGALADEVVMAKLGGSKATESAVDRALAYLASTQSEDGGWDLGAHGGQKGHDVAATGFSLLAFYGRGERHDIDCRYRDTVARGLEWLLKQQDPGSGDLRGTRPPGHAMYDHGIGTLALVEAYGVTKDPEIRPEAIAAIEFIIDSQHEEGGWRYKPGEAGDLSVTGWMIMALASAEMSGLPVPAETRKKAVRFLNYVSGGENGGRYGYTDPPGKSSDALNAVGFFCAQLMGMSPNTAKAFESAEILNKAGFGLADIYYTYYGTLAAYQHQGPAWRDWKKVMQQEFLTAQQEDGSWKLGGRYGKAMGSLISTALVTLCLEAQYRYTPLYGLGYEPNPDGPLEGVASLDSLPAVPIFRHAKHRPDLSSPAEDRGPVVTDHGDFLYLSSSRAGGFGGMDIYRARISGVEPTAPKNLGVEINSEGNETDPAVRMAGFHLLFNSDRGGGDPQLFGAKSSRVNRGHDYSKMPDGNWLKANIGWLIGLLAAFAMFVWLSLRALRGSTGAEKQEPLTGGANG